LVPVAVVIMVVGGCACDEKKLMTFKIQQFEIYAKHTKVWEQFENIGGKFLAR
jgi:hypothetical protein